MDNRNRTKLCETCEEEPATVLCSECCMCYCDKCSAFMHSKEFKKDHKTEAFPEGVVVEARCPLHKGAPLEMFCIDKTRLCCTDCKKENIYGGCKVVKLSDIAQDNEVFSASKMKAHFADALGYCEELEKEVESAADNVVNEGNNVREKIKKLFIKEHEKLVEEETRLMDELEKACNEHEEALQKNLTDFRDVCGYGRLLNGVGAKMRGGDNSRLMELNIVSEMEKQLVPMENLYKIETSNLKIKWAEEERKLTFTKSLFNGVPIPSNIQVSSVFGSKVTITWSCDDSKMDEENKSKTRYIVLIKKSSDNEWIEVYSGISKECAITGLLPATEYIIFVKCAVGELQGRLGSYVKVKTRKKTFEGSCWIKCPDDVDDEMKYDVDKENPRIATKIDEGNCTIIGNRSIPINTVASWSIKVLKSIDDDGDEIYIGIAPSDIDQDEVNYDYGWYFGCYSSTLISGPPHEYRDKEYGPTKEYGQYVHTGGSVGVVMDTEKGDLSFIINGVNLGIAYEGIPLDKPLVPCVLLRWQGDSVELDTSEVKDNVDSSIPVPFIIATESLVWSLIDIAWSTVEGAQLYHIEVDGGKSWYASTSNTFTKGGLFPETEHSFRVRAVRGNSVSEWCNVVKKKTRKTPLFSNCVWRECPDDVNEGRKYNVNIVNYRTAEKAHCDLFGNCTIIGNIPIPPNKVTSWIIKILRSRGNDGEGIYIGMAPIDINQNASNLNICGWYFDCHSSSLISGPPHNYEWSSKRYGPKKMFGQHIRRGDSVGVVMDAKRGELSFIVNRVNYGVAYEGVPLDKPLVPCVVLWNVKDSVELNTSKAKETIIDLIPIPPRITSNYVTWDTITLTWGSVKRASFYQVEVDGSRLLDASTENEFVAKGFLPETEHNFRVRTVRGSAASKWSDVVRVKTRKTPEFSECEWKGCPDYVNMFMAYIKSWDNPRIATNDNKDCEDEYCTIIGDVSIPFNAVTKWSIKILFTEESPIYVGVAPFDIDQNSGDNYSECGWYLNCSDSTLCSGPPHNYEGKAYGPRKQNGQYVHTGDSVGVVMDTTKGDLSFILNGVNLGVAYKGIPLNKPLVPCVILWGADDSVELII